ncbi:MAG: hypothetical protein NHB14_14730 [Desulfosporosinus sp.]|nr:hypothetical protein [Desulfosporosinus sp.]MDA8220350.1 hypothetical protein [Desulfitobacterium hafniense]
MAECPWSQGRREGTAGQGWPSVPGAKDGGKGLLGKYKKIRPIPFKERVGILRPALQVLAISVSIM